MKIGLLQLDGRLPNLAQLKVSAWHKAQGDEVEIYSVWGEPYDRVYISKIFSFTPDYPYYINAKEVVKGGTGYAIELVNGREVYHKEKDQPLPDEIEHTCPDYSLTDGSTAYGFLTRGCPRGCQFCIVKGKEGGQSCKVADLWEWYRGQKKIELLDPNILASKDCDDLLYQLAQTRAAVNFNQGLDARLLTERKIERLLQVKFSSLHFAWDKYEDGPVILDRLAMLKEMAGRRINEHNSVIYTIVNFNTTFEQDLERVYRLRECGFWAYIMIYDKQHADHKYIALQRWVNNRFIFAKCKSFAEYVKSLKKC